MSVILEFLFFTKHKNKSKQNSFHFGRDPTRFNLAPTYLHQRWRIRVS